MPYIDALSGLEDPGDGSKPWADLVFDITELQLDETLIAFEARGSLDGDIVGFKASLFLREWREQPDANFPLYWGYITFASIGEATDRLVSFYRDWWNLPDVMGNAVPSLRLLAAGLGADPRNRDGELARVKLFFEPRKKPFDGDDPEHGQLFLNFDVPNQRAWLLEKDPGYRRPVLSWLTGQFGSVSYPSDI